MGPREIVRSKDVTENSTGKAGKVERKGPRPWDLQSYTYKEEPRDGHGSSHDDPRLESALQRLSLHQDDFIPSDDDHGSGHPAVGLGTTPDLHASDPSASDLGTLAGGSKSAPQHYDRGNPKTYREMMEYLSNDPSAPLSNRLILKKKNPRSTPQHSVKWDYKGLY